MRQRSSAEKKVWIVVIATIIVDFFAAMLGGNTLFGNTSKGKKKK